MRGAKEAAVVVGACVACCAVPLAAVAGVAVAPVAAVGIGIAAVWVAASGWNGRRRQASGDPIAAPPGEGIADR